MDVDKLCVYMYGYTDVDVDVYGWFVVVRGWYVDFNVDVGVDVDMDGFADVHGWFADVVVNVDDVVR